MGDGYVLFAVEWWESIPHHSDRLFPRRTRHPRRGKLTTARFFNRYVNTALNKNRRRAAAVFRFFFVTI